MSKTKQHDAGLSSITLAGIPMEGLADGEFLRIEPQAPYFEDVSGADGLVVRWKTTDKRATAIVTLLAGSPTNDRLSKLLNNDVKSDNGAGVGAFEYRDNSGTSRGNAPQAWVIGLPNMTRAKSAGTVEWRFRLSNYEGFAGGNNDIGPAG